MLRVDRSGRERSEPGAAVPPLPPFGSVPPCDEKQARHSHQASGARMMERRGPAPANPERDGARTASRGRETWIRTTRESMFGLQPDPRASYDHFIRRVVESRTVWVLRHDEGWCVAPS